MRFLVDENLPGNVAAALRRLDHDVIWVTDSDLRGQPDELLIETSLQEGRVLVTLDLGVSLSARKRTVGLVLVRVPAGIRPAAIAELVSDAVSTASPDDLAGSVTVVSPGRIRRRPLRD